MTGDDSLRSQRLEMVEAPQPCIVLGRYMLARESKEAVAQEVTGDQRAGAGIPESRCVDVITVHRPENLDLVAL